MTDSHETHHFTVPGALSRPVTILGVESKLFVGLLMTPLILLYTGQWAPGVIGCLLMYGLGRLLTSSDPNFMAVVAASARLDHAVFLPEKFDDKSRDLAFRIVPDKA